MWRNNLRKTVSHVFTAVLMIGFFVGLMVLPVEAASVKAPPKVTNLKATRTGMSTIQLTWKRVAKAKGYQVYVKTANTKWKKIATLKGKKKSKYICTDLKANTEYKFRIRAYKTYKSKRKAKYKYGKYSKTVKVLTKEIASTYVLKEGYYTAGIDIPAGIFDVTAIAGIGFIYSDNGAANLRGPEINKDDISEYDDYSKDFRNYRLPKGDILEVTGVQVKIVYSEIHSDVKGRSYDEKLGTKLTPGYYVVGKDIAPGRYCVKYVSGGGGYVTTENGSGDCNINANLDGDPSTGEYVDYVSNIIIVKGETIEVTSGLTVLFIPEI